MPEPSFIKTSKTVRGAIPIDLDLLKRLYVEEKLSAPEIAKRLDVSNKVIFSRLRKLGCMRSRSEAVKLAYLQGHKKSCGSGRYMDSSGYVMVKKASHPRTQKGGYVLEHILVWEQHHKRPLPEGYHIHHLDGIRNDNRPSNLVALPPAKHQGKYPTLLEERAKRIRELEIENCQLRRALDSNQSLFLISDS